MPALTAEFSAVNCVMGTSMYDSSVAGVGSWKGVGSWEGLFPGSLMDRLQREFARGAEFALAVEFARGWGATLCVVSVKVVLSGRLSTMIGLSWLPSNAGAGRARLMQCKAVITFFESTVQNRPTLQSHVTQENRGIFFYSS
jgi:hypothetical protein